MAKVKSQQAVARTIRPEPRDTARIVDAMRKDVMFSFAARVIRATAASAVIDIVPDRENENVQRLADKLEDAWSQYIRQALDCVEYGRQVMEVAYRYDSSIGAIAPREMADVPFAISRPIIDKETGEVGLVEVGKGNPLVTLARNEYWLATYQASASNPLGKSIYRGAPWEIYQLRKTLRDQYGAWVGRYALGFGVVKAPAEAPDSGLAGKGDIGQISRDGEPVDVMDEVAKQLDRIKGGGHLILQSGNYRAEDGGGSLYEYERGPEMRGAAPLENLQRQLDVLALRSMGVPERAVINDAEAGARAIADAHQVVFFDLVEDVVRQLTSSFQRDVVDLVTRANYRGEVSLLVTWRPLGDKSESRAEQIVAAILAQPQPNPLLLRAFDLVGMLESLGYPIRPDARDMIEDLARSQPAPATAEWLSLAARARKRRLDIIEDLSHGRDPRSADRRAEANGHTAPRRF